ncbi:MAG: superoxide dismutase [Solirubrobacterales bacterium]|nr:superoxide dismutase [Solirubrobacterales bacterium]
MRGRLLAGLTASVLLVAPGAVAAATFPDRISLPDGWQPEGIASGRGHELFVGSIATGGIYRVDARTGDGSIAVPGGEGRVAIGLKVDHGERLFVAGGPTGKAFVYDARTGADLAQFQLAPDGEPTFVNDVALTRKAAYFTDSERPVVYAVDVDLSEVGELALSGIQMQPGFDLNGIVATRDGGTLLAVQSNTGGLWRIDPTTGEAHPVDLGGTPLTNGDGLLLHGRTLYAVQNELNRIAVVRLDRDLARGAVVRTITHEDFDVPTTIVRFGASLYAVNARFATPVTPSTEYWLTRVRR